MKKDRDHPHYGHRQRLREELKNHGADSFYDHKLLEIYLFPFVPWKDTNEIAHTLLQTFGSLKNIIYADWKELASVKGMTENAALNISLLPEIIKRVNYQYELAADRIDNFSQAKNIAIANLSNKQKEEVLLICLDTSGKIVRKRIISQGGLNEAYVNPRTVSEEAFRFSADKVLIAHNHPSGIAEPSKNDLEFTVNLTLALAYLDIILIDHIIVAGNNAYSFKKEGLISKALNEHIDKLPQKVVADIKKETNLW
ncbi:MAG TPA: DNA repair protein RadC [Clostridia bacterium]